MKLVLIILLFTISFFGNGQIFQERLGTMNSEAAGEIVSLTDSGMLIISPGQNNTFIYKIDAMGDLIWGSKISMDTLFGITNLLQFTNSTFALGATTFHLQKNQATIIMIDEFGNLVWTKSYSLSENIHLRPLQKTKDNGLLVPFYYDLPAQSSSSQAHGLLKTDSVGNIIWCKVYEVDSISIWSFVVTQTDDNGYLLVSDNMDVNLINSVDFSLKLDENGNVLHANQINEIELGWVDKTIRFNNNTFLNAAENNIFCMDSTGSLIWVKHIFRQTGSLIINSTTITNNKKLIVGGYTIDSSSTDAIIIEIDSAGNILNNYCYGENFRDYCLALCSTPDGGICFTGRTESFGANGIDIYLVKTDSLFNSGCYQTSSMINETIGTINQSPLILQVTDQSPSIRIDSIYAAPASINRDIICSSTKIEELSSNQSESLHVFPNPAKDNSTIYNSLGNGAMLNILNLLGEIVYSQRILYGYVQIEFVLTPGIYFVSLWNNERILGAKLIIEN